MWIILQILFMTIMLIASLVDIKKKEIPVMLIALLVVVSILAAVTSFIQQRALMDMAMCLIPGVAMIILSIVTRKEVGLGDGIILLCMGPILGFERVCACLLISLFCSCLFSIGILAIGKGNRKTTLPFVPFLTLGMGVTIICANFQVI